MLPDLRLKNYRAFEDYTIENLGQVNVLVGLNNSGKSSVLEAVRIIAEKGNPWVLVKILRDRDEMIWVDSLKPEKISLPEVSFLFNGRQPVHSKILIEAGEEKASLAIVSFSLRYWLKVEISEGISRDYEISGRGAMNVDPLDSMPENSIYIPATSMTYKQFGEVWAKVLKVRREKKAISILRILDENIEDIQVIPHPDRTEILVGSKNEKQRLPLGNYGDGMRRAIVLAAGVIAAENSILLVDEIDSGLHMSVIAKVWEMLIKTAKELNVQIFATTHSYDCLKGLADCIKKNPDECEGVRVHRIDRSLKKAITIHPEHIPVAIEGDIEMRV